MEHGPTKEAVFSAAAEPTRQREREIAELREEIKALGIAIKGERMRDFEATATVLERTLARLQRDLAVLLKGWREQDGGTK
jgi:hypothetical protein